MLRILVDTPALVKANGSGIQTYTLNMLRAHGLAGHESHLLYEVENDEDPILNELHAGEFVKQESPNFLDFRWHQLKVLGQAPAGLQRLNRSPRLVLQSRNRASYNWVANLPAWTHHHLYNKARYAQRGLKMFSRIDNPKGTFDIWHAGFHRPLFLNNAKNIVTIHDLIPLRLPETNSQEKRDWYELMKGACTKADLILATSNHTRSDLLEFLSIPEEKVRVVYQCPDLSSPLPPEECQSYLHALGLEKGNYFLYLGNIEPRKNIQRLIRAWLQLDHSIPLVIAGHKAWYWEDELALIPPGSNIRLLGYVSPEEKTSLLQNALSLVFPSLYEGFGIPPLEAMACGLPVITSRNSALPEVCGDAACYINPYHVTDLANAMRTIAENADLRADLIAKGKKRAELFTIEKFANQLNAAYEHVLGSSRSGG